MGGSWRMSPVAIVLEQAPLVLEAKHHAVLSSVPVGNFRMGAEVRVAPRAVLEKGGLLAPGYADLAAHWRQLLLRGTCGVRLDVARLIQDPPPDVRGFSLGELDTPVDRLGEGGGALGADRHRPNRLLEELDGLSGPDRSRFSEATYEVVPHLGAAGDRLPLLVEEFLRH